MVEFYRIPMKLWACNGRAGWWQPERLPQPKQPRPRRPVLDPHNPLALQKQRLTSRCAATPAAAAALLRTSAAETRTFFSAFEETSFKWMWLQCFVGHIAGKVAWCFSYYWCE